MASSALLNFHGGNAYKCVKFKEEYQQYLAESEGVYKRAMDVPLKGLDPEHAAKIKDLQFTAKQSKERLIAHFPDILRQYNNIRALALLVCNAELGAEIDRQIVVQESKIQQQMEDLRVGLRLAADELESVLIALGVEKRLDERDITNPIDRAAPLEIKVQQLQKLSLENEERVGDFLESIDKQFGTESKYNFKQPDRIAEKAQRPEILRKKPWFDVEHIRDGFRFKTVLSNLTVLPRIAEQLKASGFEIIKIDTDKLLNPGLWGWRIVVFDLKMPNGQLVEYYLPVSELESAKNAGNHEIFENWRNKDLSKLTDEETVEFMRDQDSSDNTYETAWKEYLARTNQTEQHIEQILAQLYEVLEG